MAFETLDLGRQGYASKGVPRVGVTARGLLSFNFGALELLGHPEYVEMLYDAERELVGVKASDPRLANTRKVIKNSTGMGMVSAARFVRAVGLAPTRNSTVSAELEGDILVFKPRFVNQDDLAHLNSD